MKLTFLNALTLLFVGLKLTHYIDWSWIWVLSPILFPLAIFAIALVILFSSILLIHGYLMLTLGKAGYAKWKNKQELIANFKKCSKAFRKK